MGLKCQLLSSYLKTKVTARSGEGGCVKGGGSGVLYDKSPIVRTRYLIS